MTHDSEHATMTINEDEALETGIEDIYQGETRERSKALATLLACTCPGLAYWYIGRALKGVTVNLGFVLMLEGFVIAMALLSFFPLLPMMVLVLAWVVFCGLVVLDVREEIAERGLEQDYLLKNYNHGIAYAMVAIVTFFAPILISLDLTEKNLVTVVSMESAAMYPSLLPGDVVWMDRHGFDREGVKLGDVVAVKANASDAPIHILRVVAVQGDMLRVVEGEMLYLNEVRLEKESQLFTPVGLQEPPRKMMTMVEKNQDAIYPIAYARGAKMLAEVPPLKLGDGEIFLLADNRSLEPLDTQEDERVRDSRSFGPRKVEQIQGAPRYIFWSSSPDSGDVRWDRIGLEIR